MNPFSLFNSSSLLFLGVLILVCALLFVYFENKAREQNHKISSMLSLVSSLTEEVHSIRRHIMQGGSVIKQNTVHYENNTNDEDLVSVSDDDENDDDDDDEQDDYDEDDDEQDEDDDEEDDDDDEQDDDEDKFDIMEEIGQNVIEIGDNVKVLTLLQPIELVSDGEDEDVSDNEEFDVDELGTSDEEGEDQTKNLSVDKSETQDVKIFDLKSIHLEEPPIVDYKKLSVGKLKTVVAEKGLAPETSKMKKHELLKLLGVDE
jgi:hypothetical protein